MYNNNNHHLMGMLLIVQNIVIVNIIWAKILLIHYMHNNSIQGFQFDSNDANNVNEESIVMWAKQK